AVQKGTGMWTSESAMELHVPVPTIDQAVAARDISIFKTEREAINGFRSLVPPADGSKKESIASSVHNALYFGICASYIQGMHLLQEASLAYKYEISLAEVVRIWKAGCIIRSRMLNEIRQAYLKNDLLKNLLLDKDFYNMVIAQRGDCVNTLKLAMDAQIGVPALASALSYVDMFGTGRSALNLIQAQRDFFGAHTYERLDQAGSFHTEWS
ncbi:MAG: NADP-dependent phosphogluconate dehydrogenase, partial [Chitinophagaceae bacterium]